MAYLSKIKGVSRKDTPFNCFNVLKRLFWGLLLTFDGAGGNTFDVVTL